MRPLKIILDTDMGSDCDDTAALAILHELCNEGKCEILAVTHCFQGVHFAGCIDAINRYYGRPNIPVGAFSAESGAPMMKDYYAGEIHKTFPNRFREGAEYEDTLKVLRKALASTGDGEVTLVVIGTLYSMRKLLESGPDGISELSGRALIEKKVARTVIMGGRFCEGWPDGQTDTGVCFPEAEYNIKSDIPAARVVCESWPGEMIFCSFEIGCRMITCGGLQEKGSDENPVRASYRIWHRNTGLDRIGRESWDPATALYAVCPEMGLWKIHGWGEVSVDEKGVTTWREKQGGRHTFLVENVPVESAAQAIDGILERDITRRNSGM